MAPQDDSDSCAPACFPLCLPCLSFIHDSLQGQSTLLERLSCAAGAPIGEAHKQLLTALIDHKSWSDRSKGTKDMMYQMLKVRSSMQELAAEHKLQ